jgi:hypothetical protein
LSGPRIGRQFTVFIVAGAAATALIVGAGGRIGPVRGSIPLSHWFGLLVDDTVDPRRNPFPGLLLTIGIAALVGVWLAVVRLQLAERWTERQTWTLAACWGLPLALGPPLLSSDVYTYAAHGIMVERGYDPYVVGPSVLGAARAVGAVDPTWRSTPSPYGPLATLTEHFTVAVGHGALGGVVMFRLLALASMIAIGLLASALVEPGARPLVLTLTVLNPLLLLQVLSAAHFEGLLGAAILASFVALRHGHPRIAVVLGCAAAAVKAPAIIVVLALVAASMHGRRRPEALRELGIGAALVGGCSVLFSVVLHNAWGWTAALETPTVGRTPAAPSSLAATVLERIVPVASSADDVAAGRIAALGLAGCIVAWLLVTAHRRPIMATTGLGLLVVAALGPVVYPWYLLWGLVCLAPLARSPKHVTWLAGASGLGAAATIEGLPHAWVTVETVLGIAAIAGYVLLADRPTPRLPFAAGLGRRLSSRAEPKPAEEPRPDVATVASH